MSSSWFVGTTPRLATAVTLSRGVGNEDLEGYLVPFFGGTYPAQTFKAFMDPALEGTAAQPLGRTRFLEPGARHQRWLARG